MTTYVDFAPTASQPFQFQAALDGQLYTIIVKWNLFGQRWYVNVFDLSQNLICSVPQAGCPLGYNYPNLVVGYFQTSTLVWRPQNNQFEVNP